MCIFSQPVQHVSKTCIYARGVAAEQILVYSMDVAATGDLAMILPVPIAKGSGEDALRFIDLSKYPAFFGDLRKAFPPEFAAMSYGAVPGFAPPPAPLRVHRVGSFEASFVPTIADFGRLDPRFQLSPEIWLRLPQYADWGFAVFQLRPKTEPESVHPMAFAFCRRDPGELFFPTLHVHDGAVHDLAGFDHELYCQTPTKLGPAWRENDRALGYFVDAVRVPDLIDWHANGWRQVMNGQLPNQDVLLQAADSIPPAVTA